MNVLLVSKPGISLIRSLRESETAWNAIRFYGPIGISVGVYIPVSTFAGAVSLASDLKYFLRKYTADHLFHYQPGVFFTSALVRSRYLTRDSGVTSEWPYRLMYWIENLGTIKKCHISDWNIDELLTEESDDHLESGSDMKNTHTEDLITGGYLLEVWCTKAEFDII